MTDASDIQERMAEASEEPTSPEEVEAPQGQLDTITEGLSASRDASGKFSEVRLSSERARLLGKLGRARSASAEEIARILIEAQSGTAEAVAAANNTLMAALGAIIASGKPSSLPAIEAAARALGTMISLAKMPQAGDKCPRCGQIVGGQAPIVVLSAEGARITAGQILAEGMAGAD